MELRHTKILVAGFGKSGQAAAHYCAAQGAHVTVCDAAPADRFVAAQQQLADWPITFRLGEEPLACFTNVDLVVASPGIPLTTPGFLAAREAGIPVISEMELAIQSCATPLIAITGTNGKSTTTTLVGTMLQHSGMSVAVGGNLGTPMLAQLADAERARYWVVEVSSYQLEITPSLHPHVAILLNITPDHLDRYRDFAAYVAAKSRLVQLMMPADTLIFNAEDPVVVEQIATSHATKVPFSVPRAAGCKAPLHPALHAVGAQWNDGHVRAVVPGRLVQEWDLTRSQLVGAHNQENMLAAGLAAAVVGAQANVIAEVLRTFPGLPHRCQLVREWKGIRFFDDSKGTNVGAAVKSIESFSAPVVLIAGGLDKGTGYAALQSVARTKVKCAVLIGQARHEIGSALTGSTETVMAEDMHAAVQIAARRAVAGDVVLLSPACASFDMYRNYAERGEDFQRCVMGLSGGDR